MADGDFRMAETGANARGTEAFRAHGMEREGRPFRPLQDLEALLYAARVADPVSHYSSVAQR